MFSFILCFSLRLEGRLHREIETNLIFIRALNFDTLFAFCGKFLLLLNLFNMYECMYTCILLEFPQVLRPTEPVFGVFSMMSLCIMYVCVWVNTITPQISFRLRPIWWKCYKPLSQELYSISYKSDNGLESKWNVAQLTAGMRFFFFYKITIENKKSSDKCPVCPVGDRLQVTINIIINKTC